MKKLILLLNMGGPRKSCEVEIFLKNMFNDPCILGVKNPFLRKFLAFMITKMRLKSAQENYKQIGGKSPICEITQRLCDKLNQNNKFVFDYAMNYTPPFCKEVLSRHENVDEIVVFPLYPHYSITTVTSSLNDFYKAYNELGLKAKVQEVRYFYESKEYNQIIIKSIKDKILSMDVGEISMIFSAHSLPQKIINNGDRYEAHVKEHVEILTNLLEKEGLNFKDVKLAYQSRLGPVKWLEPSLNDVLSLLKNKKALIYPLSFCVDNSETIFELDVEYRHIAKELGFEFYEVCECPNASDAFAEFIVNNIKE
ncbi:ferrochelatase [Campylobacter sp. RM12920]|uniref:Ferrochelatase n=1 Tax=Campylobacter californiensis TaxID=1032243 RepID=A0ABD4JIA2_9BACT|nr:ferrochelatase [Campylobacter sp. RM12919]MBE2987535.1 ferrochelatase [Campylobacter sp. RM12920]